MTKKELETIVKKTYDTAIKGPADEIVVMDIPDLTVGIKCSTWVSGRLIAVDLGSCWLNLQSWKFDRKTIIRTISDFVWVMMQ